MSAIAGEILIILLLTLANGVLSMSEMAIVSARKSRLQQMAEGGDRRAQAALQLAGAPTRFLSTVQIGITLVGILVGAFGGATLTEVLSSQLSRLPLLAPYAGAIALGLIVLAITYLSLVFGELLPKRLALNNPEAVAAAAAIPMQRLSRIAAPAVNLLSYSTEAVIRLLGIQTSEQMPVTEQEIRLLIAEATRAGVLEKKEEDIVKRVFRLGDRRVSSLMTHRTEIVWLDMDDPVQKWVETLSSGAHSRFPVCRKTLDNLLGVVQTSDLFARNLQGQPLDLKAALHPPIFVPEATLALEALERLRQNPIPMAFVIDEYGSLEGLVTLNDLVQEIVGDIPSVADPDAPEAVRRPDGSWLLDGMMPVDALRELLGAKVLPAELEGQVETVGGFVMAFLGQIPTTADHFEWGDLCFEVIDMDGRRVDKLLITPLRRPSLPHSDPDQKRDDPSDGEESTL